MAQVKHPCFDTSQNRNIFSLTFADLSLYGAGDSTKHCFRAFDRRESRHFVSFVRQAFAGLKNAFHQNSPNPAPYLRPISARRQRKFLDLLRSRGKTL